MSHDVPEVVDAAKLLQVTLAKAGGTERILAALEETKAMPSVAEALAIAGNSGNVGEALMAVAEAQQIESLSAVAEAVEAAGGPFVIAEALQSAGGSVAEAVAEAGGTFAVAEALASPGRAVLIEALRR